MLKRCINEVEKRLIVSLCVLACMTCPPRRLTLHSGTFKVRVIDAEGVREISLDDVTV